MIPIFQIDEMTLNLRQKLLRENPGIYRTLLLDRTTGDNIIYANPKQDVVTINIDHILGYAYYDKIISNIRYSTISKILQEKISLNLSKLSRLLQEHFPSSLLLQIGYPEIQYNSKDTDLVFPKDISFKKGDEVYFFYTIPLTLSRNIFDAFMERMKSEGVPSPRYPVGMGRKDWFVWNLLFYDKKITPEIHEDNNILLKLTNDLFIDAGTTTETDDTLGFWRAQADFTERQIKPHVTKKGLLKLAEINPPGSMK